MSRGTQYTLYEKAGVNRCAVGQHRLLNRVHLGMTHAQCNYNRLRREAIMNSAFMQRGNPSLFPVSDFKRNMGSAFTQRANPGAKAGPE